MSTIQVSISGIDGITAFIFLPKTNKHVAFNHVCVKEAKKIVKEFGFMKKWNLAKTGFGILKVNLTT
jgi:hypothetical protein